MKTLGMFALCGVCAALILSAEQPKPDTRPAINHIANAVPLPPKETTVSITEKASKPIDDDVSAQQDDLTVDEMSDRELQEALDCAEQDIAAIRAEIARRNPPKVAGPMPTKAVAVVKSASGCDPNCQCATTGICTCGPDCPCPCPRATGAGSTAANFTYQEPEPYVMVNQTSVEMQPVANRGFFGVARPGLLGYSYQPVQVTRQVSVPASSVGQFATVSSRTYVNSGTNLSSRVVSGPIVSYQASSPRVQTLVTTPVVRSSNGTVYVQQAAPRVICSGGVCRLVQ
jgi:hypothetical protein